MSTDYDVLGLGCAAVDELLYVPAYPAPDTKMRIVRRERECGGLGATALVAAARLGGRCAYAGVLGTDLLSQFVTDSLQATGIDITHIPRRANARPVLSVIIVGEETGTRNILFDNSGRTGADDELPPPDLIRRSRVLFLDQYGMTGNLRAARIARQAAVPVVADIEILGMAGLDQLLESIGHLIVSAEIAAKLTGLSDPPSAAARLWIPSRQAVVVTCGDRGCWYVNSESQQPQHHAAFKVTVADTTGCGDIFHGAYAWALARGLEMPQRIRIASAAAAIKATRPGAQRGAPDLQSVEAFLAGR
jgi:sugar/nucleoside kinase (ribokinase family)